ncbi:MAG: hypothetical protein AABX01_04890 [Candidatus Micrarchaeota archaeon]
MSKVPLHRETIKEIIECNRQIEPILVSSGYITPSQIDEFKVAYTRMLGLHYRNEFRSPVPPLSEMKDLDLKTPKGRERAFEHIADHIVQGHELRSKNKGHAADFLSELEEKMPPEMINDARKLVNGHLGVMAQLAIRHRLKEDILQFRKRLDGSDSPSK